jgi:hypothetical protein
VASTVLPGVQITALANNLPTSKAHEWNFTIGMEVMKDTLVRAGYIDTTGRNIEGRPVSKGNPISKYVAHGNSGEPVAQGFYISGRHLIRHTATSRCATSSMPRTTAEFHGEGNVVSGPPDAMRESKL